jgi:hypothetical protein
MSGVRRNLGWSWFWVARRVGRSDWHEQTTAQEAIRRAMLLPPRKPPRWLAEAAAAVEE